MSKVNVIVEGYAREIDGREFASCSVTLIQNNGLNIIVDPGMDRGALLDGLAASGLATTDINFVILTHTHLDHSLLAGIFENAKIYDGSDVYSFDGQISRHGGKVPNTEIEIVKTPGHDQFHCTVLVNTEDMGRVAIAGDIFWWAGGEEEKTDKQSLLEREDPYVKDVTALRDSRERILKIADYIIPGHGKIFRVER